MQHPSRFSRIFRRMLRLLLVVFLLGILAGVGGWYWLFRVLPQDDPEGKFTRPHINSLLSSETVVDFNDGKTMLGSFFSGQHRRYAPFDSIPKYLIDALVSGEDASYWEHGGFDPRGFARAFVHNIRTMSMSQGGSTLSQQCVKILFGRRYKSVKAKAVELVDALRLEHFFSKEDILEFYLNQFHVTGTGRGVGIAARYFFDKKLSELNLQECAFIAGSVKGPSNYDPFFQKTPEKRKRALKKGRYRVRYILDRMFAEGKIGQAERDAALRVPLLFRKGEFRSALDIPLRHIARQLNSPAMDSLLQRRGIEHWQDAGLEIVSTLEAPLHLAAVSSLKSNLSRLQFLLGAYKAPGRTKPSRISGLSAGDFVYGQVDSLWSGAGIRELRLSFGQLRGRVDEAGLRTFANRILRSRGEKSTTESRSAIFAAMLKPGAVFLVQALENSTTGVAFRCALEQVPEVQGAGLLLESGKVRALAGGFDNSGYDRVFAARRQLGSSWKPLLYAAALEQGWSHEDLLDNRNNCFRYAGSWYFPRPDHKKRADRVTMTWAATRSENVASVHLLVHLLDQLDPETFRATAARFAYLPQEGESSENFRKRLRDKKGLLLNRDARNEIRFDRAKSTLLADLVFDGEGGNLQLLQTLHFGRGWEKADAGLREGSEERKTLRHNYLRYLSLADSSIEKKIALSLLNRLQKEMETDPGDWMQIDVLRSWPDYRIALALEVFADFCRRAGIRTKLEKVLSMPLGVNSVTLAEMTATYQVLLKGKEFRGKLGDWGDAVFIEEIRNSRGETIFRNKVESRQVISPEISAALELILRSVVENGTGRRAHRALELKPSGGGTGLKFPAFGKTGTTNAYRNAAFLGGLAGVDSSGEGFSMAGGTVIGTYAGYDDNRSMKNGGIRISGAGGALPHWIGMAKSWLETRKLADHADFWDLEAVRRGSLSWNLRGAGDPIRVSKYSGIPVAENFRADTTAWVSTLRVPK